MHLWFAQYESLIPQACGPRALSIHMDKENLPCPYYNYYIHSSNFFDTPTQQYTSKNYWYSYEYTKVGSTGSMNKLQLYVHGVYYAIFKYLHQRACTVYMPVYTRSKNKFWI